MLRGWGFSPTPATQRLGDSASVSPCVQGSDTVPPTQTPSMMLMVRPGSTGLALGLVLRLLPVLLRPGRGDRNSHSAGSGGEGAPVPSHPETPGAVSQLHTLRAQEAAAPTQPGSGQREPHRSPSPAAPQAERQGPQLQVRLGPLSVRAPPPSGPQRAQPSPSYPSSLAGPGSPTAPQSLAPHLLAGGCWAPTRRPGAE